MVSLSQSDMSEPGTGRTYQETFELSIGRTEEADSNSFDDDGRPKRTGYWMTASADIIKAVIGYRVLSLPWAFAQLGWIAAPVSFILYSVVTYYTSCLLTACYRTGNQVTGNRNYTYTDAVRSHLGERMAKLCECVQHATLFGREIGSTIAASKSIEVILTAICYVIRGGKDTCEMNSSYTILSFGCVQILLSQIPDLERWLSRSNVYALMPFTYTVLGLGLVIAKFKETVKVTKGLTGIIKIQNIWSFFQAIGYVAYTYFPYSVNLLEIQDTIKSPPEESKTMSKAILVSGVVINIIDGLYGFLGYAAFGDSSPRNVLTGFDFHNPYWPVAIIANVLIVVYFVGAYQVSCQPQFQSFEKFAAEKFPDNDFIRKEFEVRIPGCKPFKLNLFKLVSRTLWVILGTFIAKKLPFFNDIIGLIGAISYWPLAVCFPVEMFIVQTEIPKWSKKWICLKMLSATCFVLTVIGAGGSAAVGLVQKYRNPSMNDY